MLLKRWKEIPFRHGLYMKVSNSIIHNSVKHQNPCHERQKSPKLIFFILLIGTKGDLRNQENVDTITFKECKKMKKKVKAYKYVECSALKCENLEEVFTEAIRAVLKKPSSKLCCSF